MTLGQKQELFGKFLSQLLAEIYFRGYAVRIGELWRTNEQATIYSLNSIDRARLISLLEKNNFTVLALAIKDNAGTGILHSVHQLKIAVDLNLFKNGVLCAMEEYRQFGEFWKKLDPDRNTCWGGDFPRPDIFHFSIMHEGVK